MYKLTLTTEFSAAHSLTNYPGVCKNIHGHNWNVSMSVSINELDDLGMAIDMVELKKYLDDVVNPFDHVLINEVKPFDKMSPTSENLARFFFEALAKKIPQKVKLLQLSVQESNNFVVSFSNEPYNL